MLSYSATSSFLVSCMLSLSPVTQLWTVTAFLSTADWLTGRAMRGGGLQFPSPLCSPLLQSSYSARPFPPFPSFYNSLAHTSPHRCALSSLGRRSTKLRSPHTSLQRKKPLSAFWDWKKCHQQRWERHQLFMLSAPHAWQRGSFILKTTDTRETWAHTCTNVHTQKKQNCCTDVPANKNWSPDVRKICLYGNRPRQLSNHCVSKMIIPTNH